MINLANLNAHLTIPVLQKAGRGVPFSYNIAYDNSIWQPVGSSGSQLWEPTNAGSFGWSFLALGSLQTLYASLNWNCYVYVIGYGYIPTGYVVDSQIAYIDNLGSEHPFAGGTYYSYGGTCNGVDQSGSGYTGSGVAVDGSGYAFSVDTSGNGKVTNRGGMVVAWTASQGQSGPSFALPIATDTNGNETTLNSSGQFYDTLSSTTPVLTVAGTAPSNTTFTYTPPSGTNVAYTMKYTSYTVKTNFGCSGISEYGPTAQNLVAEIDLPDGSKYTFTYEDTPGYSGDKTGRLASVTLPTGGSISYAYSGGSSGHITCADGSAATLTRTTPDGTWTYAHSESGTAWTTSITDPQSNVTTMNFQGIYATEAQYYQGSSTLLKTTYSCYNGSATPCNSTAISLPIAQQTATVQWPGSSNLESKIVTSYNSYGLATEKDEYGYGTGAPGSLVRKTLTTYASLGNGIVGDPGSVTVCSGTGSASACNNVGTVVAQTTYTYDQGSVTTTSGTPQHVSVS
jgi:hypothetical protein